MSVPRADFAAVALNGADILLIGGQTSPTTDTATVDLFQWPSDTLNPNPPPSMKTPRNGHSATLLQNGKVLVVGGTSEPNGPAMASAEIYDPASRTWTDAAPMAQPRAHHVAVPLNDGRVLVVGGDGGPGQPDPAGSEIYDPGTNSWTSITALFGPRATGPIAVQLPDGRVVIDDGLRQVVPGGVELYDPATGQVTYGHALNPTERSWATAALLPGDTVLIAGGQQTYQPTGAFNTTDIYDPSKDTTAGGAAPWSAGPAMHVGHCHHTMTVRKNGTIIVAGGRCGTSDSIAVVEIYNPITAMWAVVAPMKSARGFHVAVLLGDGTVLLAGGIGPGGAILSTIEVIAG